MRKRWAAALAIAAFAAGATAGLLGGRFLHMRRGANRPEEFRARFVGRFDRIARRLDLDAEQRARWDSAVQASAAEAERGFAETRGRMDAERARSMAALREILRPDQAERFDEIVARWEKRPGGRGAGGRGPRGGRLDPPPDADTMRPEPPR